MSGLRQFSMAYRWEVSLGKGWGQLGICVSGFERLCRWSPRFFWWVGDSILVVAGMQLWETANVFQPGKKCITSRNSFRCCHHILISRICSIHRRIVFAQKNPTHSRFCENRDIGFLITKVALYLNSLALEEKKTVLTNSEVVRGHQQF